MNGISYFRPIYSDIGPGISRKTKIDLVIIFRFNQGKGLTSGEKATLRRKILAKARTCGIEVKNFGKANTSEEFAAVVQELIIMETKTHYLAEILFLSEM